MGRGMNDEEEEREQEEEEEKEEPACFPFCFLSFFLSFVGAETPLTIWVISVRRLTLFAAISLLAHRFS